MSITTIQEFRDAIEEGVNADIADLPRGTTLAWFPTVSQSPTMFKVTQPVPFDQYSTVIAVFDQGEAVTVYSLPRAVPEPKPSDWKVQPPLRYTLTKNAPTYVAEELSIDTMAELIIDEWNLVAESLSSAEAEREAVADWLATQGARTADSVAEEVREGAHNEDDDSDADDDEPESKPGLNGASPATTSEAIPAEVVK
jgi:hypothetical protein